MEYSQSRLEYPPGGPYYPPVPGQLPKKYYFQRPAPPLQSPFFSTPWAPLTPSQAGAMAAAASEYPYYASYPPAAVSSPNSNGFNPEKPPMPYTWNPPPGPLPRRKRSQPGLCCEPCRQRKAKCGGSDSFCQLGKQREEKSEDTKSIYRDLNGAVIHTELERLMEKLKSQCVKWNKTDFKNRHDVFDDSSPAVPMTESRTNTQQNTGSLRHGFREASKKAHGKLMNAASSPRTMKSAWTRAYINSYLDDEQKIIDHGFKLFKNLLNHDAESFTSVEDVYSVLHVAYAMARTEGGSRYKMTAEKFKSSIKTLRNCLEPGDEVGSGKRSGQCIIFDNIIEVMWSEFEVAAAWLGERDAKFFDRLATTTERLQSLRDLLVPSPLIIADAPKDRGSRSKWLDITTTSMFGLMVGFMHAANGLWDDLLVTFKASAYSFLLQPFIVDEVLGVKAFNVLLSLDRACEYLAETLKRALAPMLQRFLSPEAMEAVFDMLRDGTIITLRQFENYLVWVGKILLAAESSFLDFAQNILRQCRTLASGLQGRMEYKAHPVWDESYSDEYLVKRLGEEQEQFQMSQNNHADRQAVSTQSSASSPSPLPTQSETSSSTSSSSSSSVRENLTLSCRKGCGKTFDRRHNLYRHENYDCVRREEVARKYVCGQKGCDRVFNRVDNVHKHRRNKHGIMETLRVRMA